MSRIIKLSHEYQTTPDKVWAVALDWQALATMSAGSVVYRGLPEGTITQGQVADFQTSAFGIMPWADYQVAAVEVDHAERRFVTNERGNGVKLWHHVLTVEETATGARQTDEIEIDAGGMTWLIATLAKRMYAKRDAARRVLLGLPPRT